VASSGDKYEGTGCGTSRHADWHGRPSVDLQESRSVEGGEELEVQVVETRTRVLGAEHPDTLNSRANLASTYRNQGRWKELKS